VLYLVYDFVVTIMIPRWHNGNEITAKRDGILLSTVHLHIYAHTHTHTHTPSLSHITSSSLYTHTPHWTHKMRHYHAFI
jgi:hypothetical protein